MASPFSWPGGLNLTGTVFSDGPDVAELEDDYFSGNIQFLDTISGNDANSGLLPELPVKTLAQAVANSAANGVLLIGKSSAESLTGAQALGLAGLHVIGCGSGTSRPRYTAAGAGITMFNVTVAGVTIENIYFPASTAAAPFRLGFTGASGEVRDCYFECGANDTVSSLVIGAGANNTSVRDTSFLSTAIRPSTGIGITSTVSDPSFENVTFDGGAFGWTGSAFTSSAAGAVTRIRIRAMNLLNRSDFLINDTGSTYKIYGLNVDGTGRVQIVA